MPARITLAVLLAAMPALLNGQMDEYHLKAAFLYNFAKFIDWPESAFTSPAEPFTICVLGQDPFGRALDDVVAGKAIGGRPIVARRFTEVTQIAGCHILFLSSSEHRRSLAAALQARQFGLLTVGESGSSSADGAIIRFILEGGKVRFEVNITGAEQEKLRFSSKLLSLATAVRH